MATTTRVLTASVNGTVYTSNANGALEAIDTCHSGTTAPTDEVANGKFWLDTSTTPAILKMYNNAAWSVVHSGGTVDINGGTIDGTVIGGTTPAAGSFTSLTSAGSTGSLFLTDTDVNATSRIWQTGENLYIDNQSAAGGDTFFRTDNGKTRAIIRDNGDISFRNTAGDADGLHWDAADLRLGIGTNSPDEALEVDGKIYINNSAPELRFTDTNTGVDHRITANSGVGNFSINIDENSEGTDPKFSVKIQDNTLLEVNEDGRTRFLNTTNETMRVDSNGNLLVGTTSGSDKVTVNGTVNATSFVGDGSSLTGIAAGAGSTQFWVNFNGTGTVSIRDDGNVSSITDYGTGNYGVSFSTSLSSSNYAAAMALDGVGSGYPLNSQSAIYPSDAGGANPSTSLFRLVTGNSANAQTKIDPSFVHVMAVL